MHDLDGSFCIPIEEIESESIEMKIEPESKNTKNELESKKTKIELESKESKPVSAIGRAIQRLKAKKTPQPESIDTGKSLSEALLFAKHGENMLCTKIVLNVKNNFCTQHVLHRFEFGIFMY